MFVPEFHLPGAFCPERRTGEEKGRKRMEEGGKRGEGSIHPIERELKRKKNTGGSMRCPSNNKVQHAEVMGGFFSHN